MKYRTIRTLVAVTVLSVFAVAGPMSADETQTSPQMEKAKDFIADEQWVRAIELLRVAADNLKEKHRDEALFWLAHSQNQARELRAAVETIARLEKEYPASRWVKPAGYLRVELAQKLRVNDVLWYVASTQPAPPPPAPLPTPAPPTTTIAMPAQPPRAPVAAGGRPVAASQAPRPPVVWISENTVADASLRIQALGSLIKTDGPRVIPMLREIALESSNPREASRAVFLLAQSGQPAAHTAVLEVARAANETVSVAAVREFGRFGGDNVSRELLKVYEFAKPRVKYQVVNSLGERAAATALLQIAESEVDAQLRSVAIVTLGQAGGRQQLLRLYGRADAASKRPIIRGLFNARAEDELIRIAEQEKDATVRNEIHAHLRLLGTPKAKAYLERVRAGGR